MIGRHYAVTTLSSLTASYTHISDIVDNVMVARLAAIFSIISNVIIILKLCVFAFYDIRSQAVH